MLKPIRDKIIVKPKERIKSSVLIVIQDEEENVGTVISVGPGKLINSIEREIMPVSIGQNVRFGTMGRDSKEEYLKFTPHFINGEKYLIMSWKDICWVEDNETIK